MEAAYDHIQEEVYNPEDSGEPHAEKKEEGSLNTDIQDAYKSFSATPWGARIGGFLGTVKKQSESYIQEARNEATIASEEALKGFSDLRTTLVSHARSMSAGESEVAAAEGSAPVENQEKSGDSADQFSKDAIRDSEGLISRFKAEAEKRLKDIQKAEEATDEALLKFGTNIRNFLRDAVTIAPPSEEKDADGKSKVLFESKDSDGKRVIHTTRFDAQIHVIHCSLDSFTKDPASPEYEKWKDGDFNVENKTDDIAADLEKYEELRRSMEKVLPEKVDYETFWKRYYFLRMVIESEEKRRKEILKGAAASEEVAWDEDSDDEPSTPQPKASIANLRVADKPTLDNDSLKPEEPRKSQDQNSQAGSDASYDVVSGATSRAPGSPKEEKDKKKKYDSDEEEDWE